MAQEQVRPQPQVSLVKLASKWALPERLLEDLALLEPEQLRLFNQLVKSRLPALQDSLERCNEPMEVYRTQGGIQTLRVLDNMLERIREDFAKGGSSI